MKDISGVLVNGDSSSTNSSTLDNSGDDDYVFTEDQRRAALELQSLYRKLGLEDLDDGFEEGLSAYDDPHFDIVARLHEVNTRFEEDETPLESDRHRRVRFKETLVDLVVPISPVRNSRIPPEYDYTEYDDDFEDDFNTDELRDMIDDEELNTTNDTDDPLGMARGEEIDAENYNSSSNMPEPSAPPLLLPINMMDEDEVKEEQVYTEEETKEEQVFSEDNTKVEQLYTEYEDKQEHAHNKDEKNKVERDFEESKPKTEQSHNEDPKKKAEHFAEDLTEDVRAYDEDLSNVEDEFDEDDYEDIHIRKISTEQDNVTEYDYNSKIPLSVKPLEHEPTYIPNEQTLAVSDKEPLLELVSEVMLDQQEIEAVTNQQETTDSTSVPEIVPKSEQKLSPSESAVHPNDNIIKSKREDINVPYDKKSASPLGTKPKKPSRMSSPPCKPRSAIKKQSPTPVVRTSVPSEVRQVSAPPPVKSGNARSRYGLTEELRQELRRLKLLEATQKKQRELEQAEERRRRQEEADSAFKAWLEMKKRTKSASSNCGKDHNARSPTRKDRENPGGKEENEEAFQAWLEHKRRQDNRDRIFQQLQRQHEAAVSDTHRSRKDSSRKAYRVWLRRKNIQQRQQSLHTIQQNGAILSATFPQNLPRALQQAQMLNRTYQAYLGSTLWAALAGMKHHPAALI